jgi:hypothetical protein
LTVAERHGEAFGQQREGPVRSIGNDVHELVDLRAMPRVDASHIDQSTSLDIRIACVFDTARTKVIANARERAPTKVLFKPRERLVEVDPIPLAHLDSLGRIVVDSPDPLNRLFLFTSDRRDSQDPTYCSEPFLSHARAKGTMNAANRLPTAADATDGPMRA